MLWIIVVILFSFWLFSFTLDIIGDVIHILIMIVILAMIFRIFQKGRKK